MAKLPNPQPVIYKITTIAQKLEALAEDLKSASQVDTFDLNSISADITVALDAAKKVCAYIEKIDPTLSALLDKAETIQMRLDGVQ